MSLFGKVLGGFVGFVVGGPVGAVAGAAIGGSNAASNAADAAGNAAKDALKVTEEVVDGVGKVIVSAGTIIVDAVSNLAQAGLNFVEGVVAFRPLRPSELNLARSVFGDSVPLERVVLSTLIGAGNRQFTLPGSMLETAAWSIPGVGPVLEAAYLLQGLSDKYVIFIGTEGYNHPLNMSRDHDRKGQTLIHELTHVWQGHHQVFQWSYVLNSLWNQCKCAPNFNAAYNATPGDQWRNYQAEQQARLIEQWYVNHHGSSIGFSNFVIPAMANSQAVKTEDLLTAYMLSNIRPGLPYADTVFPTNTSSTSAALKLFTGFASTTSTPPGLKPATTLHPVGTRGAPFSPFKPR